jgi:Spy/CpxP family protein refolding chaperone
VDITTISSLELTGEQVEQIKTLRQAHLTNIRPLQNKMGTKPKELKTLWLEIIPDQNKIAALQIEIANLRATMREKMIDYRRTAFSVLTPEQRIKHDAKGRQRSFGPGPRWSGEYGDHL